MDYGGMWKECQSTESRESIISYHHHRPRERESGNNSQQHIPTLRQSWHNVRLASKATRNEGGVTVTGQVRIIILSGAAQVVSLCGVVVVLLA